MAAAEMFVTRRGDDLVVRCMSSGREQWVIEVAEPEWAFVKDERKRYYQARRWREKAACPNAYSSECPIEEKPMAVDFRSIVLINLFAKLVRQTRDAGFASFSVTEMLS